MQEEHSEAAARGRYGYVSAYDPKRHMARVRFPDKDNMISAWLPVAVPNSRKNKDECHLDIDEHVYCNMLGNGLEAGVVLCSIWDDKNTPPVGDQDIRHTTFEDGTTIFQDRKSKIFQIKDSFGSYIRFEDGNIYIWSAKNVYINEGK